MWWTDEELNAIHEIKRQCLYGLYLHSRSAYVNHLLHNAIVIPNIFLGGVLSVSLFAASSAPWKIAGGAIALASTFLTGLSKHLGAAEKSQLHCLVVREYQRLIQDINVYLHTPVESAYATIQRFQKEMDKITCLQPDPSIWVMRRFHAVQLARFENMMLTDFEKTMVRDATTVHNRVSLRNFKYSNDTNRPRIEELEEYENVKYSWNDDDS